MQYREIELSGNVPGYGRYMEPHEPGTLDARGSQYEYDLLLSAGSREIGAAMFETVSFEQQQSTTP